MFGMAGERAATIADENETATGPVRENESLGRDGVSAGTNRRYTAVARGWTRWYCHGCP